MKIGFYPRYDRLGASSRYRFFMFFENGVTYEKHFLYMQDKNEGCLTKHPSIHGPKNAVAKFHSKRPV